ncbi:MAG: CorA family divalent cation transporter, partial [Nanoarchaeota archaeon]
INVVNPDMVELTSLSEKYSLNLELLEEGLDENELPRIDFEDHHTYIFVKTIFREKNVLGTLLMVLSKEFFLTLAKEEPHSIKNIQEGKVEFITTQKRKCLITLLSVINDNFENTVTKIVKNVHKKKNITDNLKESDIEDFLHEEDFLNNLVSSYYYTGALYSKMIRKIEFYEEDKEFIKDLIVESDQGLNLCRNALKTISNIRHYYSIILSNKLNRTLKVLTIFTILISILAAVSSVFGMNIKLPFQDQELAFLFVMFIVAAIMAAFLLYFRSKRII